MTARPAFQPLDRPTVEPPPPLVLRAMTYFAPKFHLFFFLSLYKDYHFESRTSLDMWLPHPEIRRFSTPVALRKFSLINSQSKFWHLVVKLLLIKYAC